MKNFILGKTSRGSTFLWPSYQQGGLGIGMLHTF
jgi:hypothetical protein